MRRVQGPLGTVLLALSVAACAGNPGPARPDTAAPHPVTRTTDTRTVVHLLNRMTFGPRPGDIERVLAIGVSAYIDEQLHPERIPDEVVQPRLAALSPLTISARAYALDFYAPMVAARQQYASSQRSPSASTKISVLRGHLLPIAAVTLPGGDRPVSLLQQAPVTTEEVVSQRKNQDVFDALQAQKLLRAVYGARQLEEVLTDFWFNHFNVDARKIEDRPVIMEYERDVIRPHVLGKFRDLLGATAKSPAMLFYLDNWLSAAPPPVPQRRPAGPSSPSRPGPRPPAPRPAPAGRGLNENYGRELMELHTLGVDGGYTQRDVVDVARSFTGWTLGDPHAGTGFVFNDKMHDHGAKRVLGRAIKAGRGIQDGEQVLDLLARHPATAHFISTKLVRHFVGDDPPRALVERAAKVFSRTDGDLREVMRTILTSREFSADAAFRAKVKTPFEYVASALRATNASITNARSFVNTIAAMGEPLYQCQPPTGYSDRASAWMNTGTLVSRLNFALGLAANGLNAAKVDLPGSEGEVNRFAASVLADDVSPTTRNAIAPSKTPFAVRTGLLLGSPEFQRR
jgi:uncharacterized protein (DUF1800 family)